MPPSWGVAFAPARWRGPAAGCGEPAGCARRAPSPCGARPWLWPLPWERTLVQKECRSRGICPAEKRSRCLRIRPAAQDLALVALLAVHPARPVSKWASEGTRTVVEGSGARRRRRLAVVAGVSGRCPHRSASSRVVRLMGSFQAMRAAPRSVSARTPRPSSWRPSASASAEDAKKDPASAEAADATSARIVLSNEATGEVA
jgi:hypothetical protein